MVREKSVYLFIGQDSLSKERILTKIKQDFLKKETEQFNLDILYAKELTLLSLQERLLFLPFKSAKRIVIIKNAQNLKEDIKAFLLSYIKKPELKIILILDIDKFELKDDFLNRISKFARLYRFRQEERLDTFILSRQIELKRIGPSLRILNQLLQNGEKPERILGGLRYVWERGLASPIEKRKRLRLLLNCDIDIKTGRLKSVFALERFIVNLCGLKNSSA